jgi:hypothetical protein
MSWHKIPLNQDEVIQGETEKITSIFNDVINSCHQIRHTNGIAIFEAKEDDSNYIYFSPASVKLPALVDLINIYSGLLCRPPFRGSVHYLAGDVNYARFFL